MTPPPDLAAIRARTAAAMERVREANRGDSFTAPVADWWDDVEPLAADNGALADEVERLRAAALAYLAAESRLDDVCDRMLATVDCPTAAEHGAARDAVCVARASLRAQVPA